MSLDHNTPRFETAGHRDFDNLIGGDHPLVTDALVLATGEGPLVRGAVLGLVTASGEVKLSVDTAVDGSEVPHSILAQDADATAAAVTVPVYLAGQFNQEALTFGGAHTAASVKAGLRDKSIYLRASVTA